MDTNLRIHEWSITVLLDTEKNRAINCELSLILPQRDQWSSWSSSFIAHIAWLFGATFNPLGPSERAEQFAKRCVECGCQQSRYSLSATSLPIHCAPLVVANFMFISHIKNTLKIYIIWEFSRFIDSRLVKSWNNVILYQHFRWIKRKKTKRKWICSTWPLNGQKRLATTGQEWYIWKRTTVWNWLLRCCTAQKFLRWIRKWGIGVCKIIATAIMVHVI